MSATLRVADFAENPTLFSKPPPVLHITARQHPVTMHFARRTQHDYLAQAYKKVARIHARLPPGGVLVFCTGQNEIVSLVKQLEKKFGPKAIADRKERVRRAAAARAAGRPFGRPQVENDADADAALDAKLAGRVEVGDDLEAEEVDLGEDRDLADGVDDGNWDADDDEALESDVDGEDDDTFKGIDMEADTDEPMHVLPLYSLLPTERQMQVFADPPEGHRLVVVATNVAETAITIPNVKYVVDTGRAKEVSFEQCQTSSRGCELTRMWSWAAEIRSCQRYPIVRGRLDLEGLRSATSRSCRSYRPRSLLPLVLVGRIRAAL